MALLRKGRKGKEREGKEHTQGNTRTFEIRVGRTSAEGIEKSQYRLNVFYKPQNPADQKRKTTPPQSVENRPTKIATTIVFDSGGVRKKKSTKKRALALTGSGREMYR
jgi:hypothetical protein